MAHLSETVFSKDSEESTFSASNESAMGDSSDCIILRRMGMWNTSTRHECSTNIPSLVTTIPVNQQSWKIGKSSIFWSYLWYLPEKKMIFLKAMLVKIGGVAWLLPWHQLQLSQPDFKGCQWRDLVYEIIRIYLGSCSYPKRYPRPFLSLLNLEFLEFSAPYGLHLVNRHGNPSIFLVHLGKILTISQKKCKYIYIYIYIYTYLQIVDFRHLFFCTQHWRT